jgi:hypothetical protein
MEKYFFQIALMGTLDVRSAFEMLLTNLKINFFTEMSTGLASNFMLD